MVQALRNLIHLCSALHASPALGTIGVQDDVGAGEGDEDDDDDADGAPYHQPYSLSHFITHKPRVERYTKSMRLKYEPVLEPLHIVVMQYTTNRRRRDCRGRRRR